jgi:predicted AAA+ superfamily ATPase
MLKSKNSGKSSGSELTVDDKPTESSFQWPVFKDKTYGRFLKHFMFSFKNIYSENFNSSNLMFITGPSKCGKSVFLRQNMIDFVETGKHNPVVFHFDFEDMNSIATFDVFLARFEAKLV